MTTTPADKAQWLDTLLWKYSEQFVLTKSHSGAKKTIEEAKALILDHLQEHERLARIDELKQLLHTQVCEYMLGWSKKCDVQGDICPKLRKRLHELKAAPDTKQEPSPQQQEEQ